MEIVKTENPKIYEHVPTQYLKDGSFVFWKDHLLHWYVPEHARTYITPITDTSTIFCDMLSYNNTLYYADSFEFKEWNATTNTSRILTDSYQGIPDKVVVINNKPYIKFSSTEYLNPEDGKFYYECIGFETHLKRKTGILFTTPNYIAVYLRYRENVTGNWTCVINYDIYLYKISGELMRTEHVKFNHDNIKKSMKFIKSCYKQIGSLTIQFGSTIISPIT